MATNLLPHTRELEAIRRDERVKFLFHVPDGRVFITIPVDLIETDDVLVKLRADAIKKEATGLIQQSIREDSDTTYPIVLMVTVNDDDPPRYICGDGHQRLNGLAANSIKETTAMVKLSWNSIEDVIRGGVMLNQARGDMSDADIMSVFRVSGMAPSELTKYTTITLKKLERLHQVSQHDWLMHAVNLKAIGYSVAATLSAAADGNAQKLKALENSLGSVVAEAVRLAKYYRRLMKESKGAKFTKNDRKKRQVKEHVQEDWARWANCLEEGEIVKKEDGEIYLDIDAEQGGKKTAVLIGLPEEWRAGPVLANFAGREWEDFRDVDIADLNKQWPGLGKFIAAEHDRRMRLNAAKENPFPGEGEDRSTDRTEAPTKMDVDMSIAPPKQSEADDSTVIEDPDTVDDDDDDDQDDDEWDVDETAQDDDDGAAAPALK